MQMYMYACDITLFSEIKRTHMYDDLLITNVTRSVNNVEQCKMPGIILLGDCSAYFVFLGSDVRSLPGTANFPS